MEILRLPDGMLCRQRVLCAVPSLDQHVDEILSTHTQLHFTYVPHDSSPEQRSVCSA